MTSVTAAGTTVAVVTGGSAGVGRATVRELARRGFDVAVVARGQAGLDATVADVVASGQRGLGIRCDVADAESVNAAAQQVEDELGPIAAWVNNAFVGSLAYSWDVPAEEHQRITDVAYHGQVHGTLAALQHMRPRDRGRIVNVSSSLAHRGIPLQAAYCGAKHAVKGFTESVITELAATGSRVTVGLVTLPGVNTPQFDWNDDHLPGHPMPVPPIYQPEVCARAIVSSIVKPRRDLWVGTPTVYTIWGERLVPGLMDWYLSRNGVDSQTTDELTETSANNVFEPGDADRDHGAHGAFDDQARATDLVSGLLGRLPSMTAGAGAAATRVVGTAAGSVVEKGLGWLRRVS